MSEKKELKLSDEAIGQVAKLIQLAIFSGTDIVDHMRMMRLQADDSGNLVLAADYREMFEEQIEKLAANAAALINDGTVKRPEIAEA